MTNIITGGLWKPTLAASIRKGLGGLNACVQHLLWTTAITRIPDIIRIGCLIFLITNRPHSVLSLDKRLKRLQINNSNILVFISDTRAKTICQAFLIWFIYIYFSHSGRIYQLFFFHNYIRCHKENKLITLVSSVHCADTIPKNKVRFNHTR